MDISYSQQWYPGVAMTSSPNGQDQCSQPHRARKSLGVYGVLSMSTYEWNVLGFFACTFNSFDS